MEFLTLKPTDLENQGWIFYPAQIFSRFNDPKYKLEKKLTLALENVEMENWGAWLNVSQSIIVSEAEQYIFMRDFEQFQGTKEGADNTHHSLHDTHAIYAQITFQIFDNDHIIKAEFYTK